MAVIRHDFRRQALTDVLQSARGSCSVADAADSLRSTRNDDADSFEQLGGCSAGGADGDCVRAYHAAPGGLVSYKP